MILDVYKDIKHDFIFGLFNDAVKEIGWDGLD
jgi:hypothetical protein